MKTSNKFTKLNNAREVLENNNEVSYLDPNFIGSKLRTERIKPLLSIIHNLYVKNGSVSILDIGGTKEYWRILPLGFLEQNNAFITILNLPSQITSRDEERYKFLNGDACNLSMIADYSFDIAHSNSVIEHVGDWRRMVQFSNEIKRVAKIYYVQTPNYWFPVEPHCMTPIFHWLPKPIRISLVMKFSLGNWKRQKTVSDAMKLVEHVRLLDINMFRELFNDAEIVTEKYLFLNKSLIAIKHN